MTLRNYSLGLLFVFSLPCGILSSATAANSTEAAPTSRTVFPDIPGAMNATSTDAASWRGAIHCGPNALYGYLRLHGKAVSREDVGAQVPLTERGSSLEQLKSAANYFGVPSDVIKCKARDMLGAPKPCIFHISSGPEGGHVVVLLGEKVENPSMMVVADFNRCEVTAWPYSQFVRLADGYALIPKVPDNRVLKVVVSLAIVSAIGFWSSRRFPLTARNRTAP